jgi:hypothetical protein
MSWRQFREKVRIKDLSPQRSQGVTEKSTSSAVEVNSATHLETQSSLRTSAELAEICELSGFGLKLIL